MPSFHLSTPHGLINITDTNPTSDKPALLLIHGNSCSSKIWRHILTSPSLTLTQRIIAFDLPGHGTSSNAIDAEKSYWQRGYADLALYILQHLKISSVVVLGWSLGGHIGIELIPLLSAASIDLRGLVIVGTPPALGAQQVRAGFHFLASAGGEGLGFAGMEIWSDADAEEFARSSAAAGKPELFEEWMLEDAKRTDGKARVIMSKRFGGREEDTRGVDQRKVVETWDGLVAVVNGGAEPYVDLDYLDAIKWKKLWKGHCVRLAELKHAPFWEDPEQFEALLVEFLGDC